MPARPAVNSTYRFSSNATKSSYILSTIAASFDAAEAYCNSQGAHLAAYSSPAEQSRVERFYFDYGVILPGYHTFYYIGLNVTANMTWPDFTFIDGTPAPNASNGTYVNWGNYSADPTSSLTIPEPNNLVPPEHCAGANYTESSNVPWQWSDTNCNSAWPFLCELLREWPGGREAAWRHGAHQWLTAPCT
jgi:hypothetical protein